MRKYQLTAIEEHFDGPTGLVTYKCNSDGSPMELGPGLIVLGPLAADRDMMIMNPYYDGGELVVKMRPLRMPARKYKLNEVVAYLLVV